MPQLVTLDEARILLCDWNESGGQLKYDISHLHPDWDVLLQTYRVDSQDYKGQLIYTSEFRLYKRGESEASDFTGYPKEAKMALWQLIFAVKHKFFAEVQPAIVEHFIKQFHSVDRRYQLYAKYLAFPNYTIVPSDYDIVYFRDADPVS